MELEEEKSVARVRLVAGDGKVIINNRDIENYFPIETLRVIVNQPLVLTETKDKYDVLVNVHGGGFTGQAGAVRHGISRALVKADENMKSSLKSWFLNKRSKNERKKEIWIKESKKISTILKEIIWNQKERLFLSFLFIA